VPTIPEAVYLNNWQITSDSHQGSDGDSTSKRQHSSMKRAKKRTAIYISSSEDSSSETETVKGKGQYALAG
jgi:hypothetical protein